MRVVWTDDALLDIERHTGYIAQFNPLAAAVVARHLLKAGNSLVTFSRRGRIGSEQGTREFVAIHPYILVYEENSSEVVILRVWHGGQQR